MKVYILRNELHNLEDPTFMTELTDEGIYNSNTSLKELLESIEIDTVYSSPFIRTLQTILPYVKFKKINVKIDYSLSEIIKNKLFIEKPDIELTVSLKKKYLVDKDYNSIWNKNILKYKERNMQIKHRVKMFISYLFKKYEKTNKQILICTHMGICNHILSILSEEIVNSKYDIGKISTIENNRIKFLN
jgi:broad specificity phosphatase PhoE